MPSHWDKGGGRWNSRAEGCGGRAGTAGGSEMQRQWLRNSSRLLGWRGAERGGVLRRQISQDRLSVSVVSGFPPRCSARAPVNDFTPASILQTPLYSHDKMARRTACVYFRCWGLESIMFSHHLWLFWFFFFRRKVVKPHDSILSFSPSCLNTAL